MCQGASARYLSPSFGRNALLFIYLGGDFIKGDGTGSFSIYGDKFPVRACQSFSSRSAF